MVNPCITKAPQSQDCAKVLSGYGAAGEAGKKGLQVILADYVLKSSPLLMSIIKAALVIDPKKRATATKLYEMSTA